MSKKRECLFRIVLILNIICFIFLLERQASAIEEDVVLIGHSEYSSFVDDLPSKKRDIWNAKFANKEIIEYSDKLKDIDSVDIQFLSNEREEVNMIFMKRLFFFSMIIMSIIGLILIALTEPLNSVLFFLFIALAVSIFVRNNAKEERLLEGADYITFKESVLVEDEYNCENNKEEEILILKERIEELENATD